MTIEEVRSVISSVQEDPENFSGILLEGSLPNHLIDLIPDRIDQLGCRIAAENTAGYYRSLPPENNKEVADYFARQVENFIRDHYQPD